MTDQILTGRMEDFISMKSKLSLIIGKLGFNQVCNLFFPILQNWGGHGYMTTRTITLVTFMVCISLRKLAIGFHSL